MKSVKVSTDIIMCIEACFISKTQAVELNIKGWVFSRKSKNPLDIEVLEAGPGNISIVRSVRQDVFKRYPTYGGALNSGFTIKIFNIEDKKNVRIKFKDITNGKSKIHNINVGRLLNQKRVSTNRKKAAQTKIIPEQAKTDSSKKAVGNNQKICFITCVNDRNRYEKALSYIKALRVPSGYAVEHICINDAKYLTEAYNRGMRKTSAKYKVYMHQDVYITNPNFISSIINIFEKNKGIGMLGMAGAKTLPGNGIWHHSSLKYGNLIHIPYPDGKQVPWRYGNFKNEYEIVKCIDGLMMITQYDVPWREDIFTGWHFYDTSQSIEFIKAGYNVAVPRMDKIWCIHDCPKSEKDRHKNYDKYRQIFVNEYRGYLG